MYMFFVMRQAVFTAVVALALAADAFPLSGRLQEDSFTTSSRHVPVGPPNILKQRSLTANNTALLQALQNAVTEEDRLNILVPDPSDSSKLLHQFKNNTVALPTGGTVDLATVENYPALLGTNVAMAIGFLNPCSLNTPHTHLRANEILTVIQGTLVAAIIPENNPGSFGHVTGSTDNVPLTGPLPQINATLGQYQAILFPQGSVHWQYNPTCEPAVFAAAFDSNDPGRMELARVLFSIESDAVLNAALGGKNALSPANIARIRGMVPSSYADVIEDCARTCGM